MRIPTGSPFGLAVPYGGKQAARTGLTAMHLYPARYGESILGLGLSIIDCIELQFIRNILFWTGLIPMVCKGSVQGNQPRQVAEPSG